MFARIARDMPPVRGILHAAMVLDDGMISQLDGERVRRVMAPKVLGGWHLHQLSLGLDLDFFVLFSSMSSLIGNAGQANYVAANQFLIALAHHRRQLGLPALAVDWGRIADTGYVDRNEEVAQRFERMGVLGMPVAQATEALGRMMLSDASHLGLLRVDWPVATRSGDGWVPKRLSEMVDASAGAAEGGQQKLNEVVMAAPEEERMELLITMLKEQVANVLRAPSSDLDTERPLSDLGLDSLMAIDLVNRIESDFEVSMPRDRVAVGVTISALAATLIELLTGAEAAPARTGGGPLRRGGAPPVPGAAAQRRRAAAAVPDPSAGWRGRGLRAPGGEAAGEPADRRHPVAGPRHQGGGVRHVRGDGRGLCRADRPAAAGGLAAPGWLLVRRVRGAGRGGGAGAQGAPRGARRHHGFRSDLGGFLTVGEPSGRREFVQELFTGPRARRRSLQGHGRRGAGGGGGARWWKR